MGLSPARASASVRFSLHKQTTIQDVGFAIWQVAEALERLRAHTNFSPDRRSVSLPQNV